MIEFVFSKSNLLVCTRTEFLIAIAYNTLRVKLLRKVFFVSRTDEEIFTLLCSMTKCELVEKP